MNLYLVEYDNGEEYEYHDTETIGIFESLEKATNFITSCGFIQKKEDYFVRQHHYVPGESSKHQDYVYIYPFELNKQKEETAFFIHHYKKG